MTQADRDQLEEATKAWAAQINLPYFDTRPDLDITPLVGKLTVEGMNAYGIVPVKLEGTALTLGINERTDRSQLDSLKSRLTAYQVDFAVISQLGWQRLYNRFALAAKTPAKDSDCAAFGQDVANADPKEMIQLIAQLAYSLGASDIHLEPGADHARLRFRIDGELQPVITLPPERYDLLTSDLQMRAGAKWNADAPQQGRIELQLIDPNGDIAPVNMRLETIPALHGQDVVIRIFNLNVGYLKLEALALDKDQRAILERVISHPRGLILTVGPTGSGKTSSLYAIINQLNAPDVKIVTLEDPIEYELDGVSQLPVRSEDAELFMQKLRAVLREDPNIIMIGEIRDADTAKTALQAALTGHLVLSSFHAASSATAVTRLMDMIGPNPLMGSSLRLILAQRLVRRLCPDCREQVTPTKQELTEIKQALHGLAAFAHPAIESAKIYHPKGCDNCHSGYRGRVGLFELMEITPDLEVMIARGTTVTSGEIQAAAVDHGMHTLLQDGVLKVLAGDTTLEEVYAAVGD